MRLGYHTITWGGVVGDATGVTSIKDLYYRANGSMAAAIRDIGSVGYQGIEIFDGNLVEYQDRPDEFKGLMSDAGLELVSVYTELEKLPPTMRSVIILRALEDTSYRDLSSILRQPTPRKAIRLLRKRRAGSQA